jgi:hypothetical protein
MSFKCKTMSPVYFVKDVTGLYLTSILSQRERKCQSTPSE